MSRPANTKTIPTAVWTFLIFGFVLASFPASLHAASSCTYLLTSVANPPNLDVDDCFTVVLVPFGSASAVTYIDSCSTSPSAPLTFNAADADTLRITMYDTSCCGCGHWGFVLTGMTNGGTVTLAPPAFCNPSFPALSTCLQPPVSSVPCCPACGSLSAPGTIFEGDLAGLGFVCQPPTATPTPSPTPSRTPTLTRTPTPTRTPTVSPTWSMTPTGTPTPTIPFTLSPTPTFTRTPTFTPTSTRTPPPGEEFWVSRNVSQPDWHDPPVVIRVGLSRAGNYHLKIYNTAGELVKVLRSGRVEGPVREEIEWDARNDKGEPVSSGVYLIQLTTSDKVQIARLLVLR